jgi:hypothetical protein
MSESSLMALSPAYFAHNGGSSNNDNQPAGYTTTGNDANLFSQIFSNFDGFDGYSQNDDSQNDDNGANYNTNDRFNDRSMSYRGNAGYGSNSNSGYDGSNPRYNSARDEGDNSDSGFPFYGTTLTSSNSRTGGEIGGMPGVNSNQIDGNSIGGINSINRINSMNNIHNASGRNRQGFGYDSNSYGDYGALDLGGFASMGILNQPGISSGVHNMMVLIIAICLSFWLFKVQYRFLSAIEVREKIKHLQRNGDESNIIQLRGEVQFYRSP